MPVRSATSEENTVHACGREYFINTHWHPARVELRDDEVTNRSVSVNVATVACSQNDLIVTMWTHLVQIYSCNNAALAHFAGNSVSKRAALVSVWICCIRINFNDSCDAHVFVQILCEVPSCRFCKLHLAVAFLLHSMRGGDDHRKRAK